MERFGPGDIIRAVYEGRLRPRDIEKKVGEYRTAHYRENPTKFGPASLDAPAYRDSPTPLIETLCSDQSLW